MTPESKLFKLVENEPSFNNVKFKINLHLTMCWIVIVESTFQYYVAIKIHTFNTNSTVYFSLISFTGIFKTNPLHKSPFRTRSPANSRMQCEIGLSAILLSKPIQVATISNMTQILDAYDEYGINGRRMLSVRPRTMRRTIL